MDIPLWKKFRPLLAETVEDDSTLQFPMYASPKYDGIRCIYIRGAGVLSRNLKPIPNHHVRGLIEEFFQRPEYRYVEMVDGELLSGKNFQDCTSAFMSFYGTPEFTYNTFDFFGPGSGHEESFSTRYNYLVSTFQRDDIPEWFKIAPQLQLFSLAQMETYEELVLKKGFEGVILRSPEGRYKFGRSTLKQRIMLKIKRFKDDEATVIGVEPIYTNTNEATINELGYTQRSTMQEGRIPIDRLGALTVQNEKGIFSIGGGPGMTFELRDALWGIRETLIGKIVKFKYFDYGVKDVPRFPQFLGFRDPIDL